MVGRLYLYPAGQGIVSDAHREDSLAFLEMTDDEKALEALRYYPELASIATSPDALHRVFGQFHLDRVIERKAGELHTATYGQNASTYRREIEYLLQLHPNASPRFVILGAQFPGAARQVMNFTEKYSPTSVTLVDSSEASVQLSQKYVFYHEGGKAIEGVVADFTDREQTITIPAYDIALGDRILNYIFDGSGRVTDEQNFQRVVHFLENVAQSLTVGGGIILLNEYTHNVKCMLDNITQLKEELQRIGLVLTIDSAIPFDQLPDYVALKDSKYTQPISTQPNIVALTFRKTAIRI